MTITPDASLSAVVNRLKAASGGSLYRKINAAIKSQSRPAVAAAQQAFRSSSLPIQGRSGGGGGGGSTGLRARVAGAVTTKITASGIRIEVDGKKVDRRYGTALILGLNGMAKLRHPVFGNRRAWVQQRGPREIFYAALKPLEAEWKRACEQALDEVAREIG
jgi:hypothetical protein